MMKLPVILLFALWSTSASAGVILSPTAIVQDTICCIEGGTNTPAIDQSGLSAPFVSGSTDFASYIASNPTHGGSPPPPTSLITGSIPGADPPVCDGCLLDFDLGRVYSIRQLALWNGAFGDFSLSGFTVFTAMTMDFLDAAMVGSFTNPEGDMFSLRLATVFDLTDSEGAFVRLRIDSVRSVQIFIGEIAFDVVPLAVSEPATLALLGLALAGLGFRSPQAALSSTSRARTPPAWRGFCFRARSLLRSAALSARPEESAERASMIHDGNVWREAGTA